MAETTKESRVTTPPFRVSWAQVFEPKTKIKEKTGEKYFVYSLTALFPKTADLSGMKAIAAAAMTVKFGADQTKWPKLKNKLFRDGSEKDYDGYGPDVVFCTISSKYKPGIVDAHPGPDGKLVAITDPNEFYSGCWARATVTAYYYETSGNNGVAFGMRNLQKIKDDERFGGGVSAENDFDAIPTPGGSNVAPAGAGAEAEDNLFA